MADAAAGANGAGPSPTNAATAALKGFERAGAVRDDYPPIHARLGDFLLVSGDAEGSLAAFERAREVSAGLAWPETRERGIEGTT